MSALFFLDAKVGGFSPDQYASLRKAVPGMIALACLSYFFRYLRWKKIFHIRNMSWPFGYGFLAYLSGFAFTVTPGKVGELIRVRYFSVYNISSRAVVSGFFYERCLDLLIVLLLSAIFFSNSSAYPLVLLFVILVITAVSGCVACAVWVRLLARVIRRLGYRRIAASMTYIARVAYEIRGWCKWRVLVPSLYLGVVAWMLMAFTLVWLLWCADLLGIVPFIHAFAMYPFAMLAGAASMMPGGLGSTEAVMTVSLMHYGVDMPFSIACAMVTRLATMWLSVACGVVSVAILEMRRARFGGG